MRKQTRDFSLLLGSFEPGSHNAITDVPGVRVGHRTLVFEHPRVIRTGVTAIVPARDNVFARPLPAACSVINGYGKTAGLVQINELGRLETPIVLTNTLAVGTAFEALVRYSVAANPELTSVNPVVGECNDSHLSDITALPVSIDHVLAAIENATDGPVETGSVGAGTGTVCFGYKGGIGTASRIIPVDGKNHTIGVLVQSNYGSMDQLMIQGQKIPPLDEKGFESTAGSIMVVMATDIPLSSRQLRRMAGRAGFGIARTGGTCGHGSGEIVIAFSTANRVPRNTQTDIVHVRHLNENRPVMSKIFNAVIDCVEEAILDSLFSAHTTTGINGNIVRELPTERFSAGD
jgi:D-aminopeptidase